MLVTSWQFFSLVRWEESRCPFLGADAIDGFTWVILFKTQRFRPNHPHFPVDEEVDAQRGFCGRGLGSVLSAAQGRSAVGAGLLFHAVFYFIMKF